PSNSTTLQPQSPHPKQMFKIFPTASQLIRLKYYETVNFMLNKVAGYGRSFYLCPTEKRKMFSKRRRAFR
ncbi:hypothetical protein, partial [Chryseobacterium sp. JV558]|uniref:hypothetical protein n=1 Tax=Chryseobacterium sp. JV558 TaxID=2663236 RepID=UPI00299EEFBD